MHDKILEILMDQDEITWQSILMELIRSEQMDPWDINITLLTKKFVQTLKDMKGLNLRVSGKVILAAAILLRIKSSRLLGADLMEFDRLLASGDNDEDLYGLDDEEYEGPGVAFDIGSEKLRLIPKTPQPRKRKVSVYDLVDALGQALHVKKRRINRPFAGAKIELPTKVFDINEMMDQLYEEVVAYFDSHQKKRMMFTELVPSESKEDKVFTFIPLLHLCNARSIDLDQENHFEDFGITILDK